MKIYTKTGDKGKTSLFSGERVSKDHPLIEVIGEVDECNSVIGMALSFLPKEQKFTLLEERLLHIQNILFELGALLASSLQPLPPSEVEKLEHWIDEMDTQLPLLQHFILPNGLSPSSILQLARTICRRAERRMTQIIKADNEPLGNFIYLNRLSDFLFVAARYINFLSNIPETIWISKLSK